MLQRSAVIGAKRTEENLGDLTREPNRAGSLVPGVHAPALSEGADLVGIPCPLYAVLNEPIHFSDVSCRCPFQQVGVKATLLAVFRTRAFPSREQWNLFLRLPKR